MVDLCEKLRHLDVAKARAGAIKCAIGDIPKRPQFEHHLVQGLTQKSRPKFLDIHKKIENITDKVKVNSFIFLFLVKAWEE